MTDEELTELALAADPDTEVADGAVSFWELTATGGEQVLPEWYMPTPMGRCRETRPWHRAVAALVIASFLAIDAYGLCSTYGAIVFA